MAKFGDDSTWSIKRYALAKISPVGFVFCFLTFT